MFVRLDGLFSFGIEDKTVKFDNSFVSHHLTEWSKPIELADRVHIVGNVMRHIGQLNIAIELLEKGRDLSRDITPLKKIKLLNDLGAAYSDINNWVKAEEAYEESYSG